MCVCVCVCVCVCARADEMCELFIARGVVPNLIKLTETEEPEEV